MALELLCDDRERLASLSKHGYDFAELEAGFFDEATIFRARSGRLRAVSPFGDRTGSATFRGVGDEAVSIISRTIASKAERRRL